MIVIAWIIGGCAIVVALAIAACFYFGRDLEDYGDLDDF